MAIQGIKVGYVRVYSLEQNEVRQLAGMELSRTFTDKCSGATTDRPALQEALAFLREGDELYVHSMDRLSRSLSDLRTMVEMLTKRGVSVTFVKESLTFGTEQSPMAMLMLSLLGAVAEYERSLIRERVREGVAQAKLRGVYKGRQFKLDAAGVQRLKERAATGVKKVELMQEFDLSRQALYMYLNKR